VIRNSDAFADIRFSSPHLVREIDYMASKRNLTKPGEIVRGVPAASGSSPSPLSASNRKSLAVAAAHAARQFQWDV
jgi:hypothetical protein